MSSTLKTTALITALAASFSAVNAQEFSLQLASSIRNGDPSDLFDESAAEIVSYDPVNQYMYVVNGAADSIDIFDISDPYNPFLFDSVDLSSFGNPNSVDVCPNYGRNEVAVAVGSGEADERGHVILMEKDGDIIESYEVGYLPDMLVYDPSGRRIIVANEGEPNDDYSFDPEGSVSILERRRFGGSSYTVTELGFSGIEESDLNGARITGPDGTTIAQDLEPEYIAVDPAGQYAFVACQENNAIIIVDILSKSLVGMYGLGYKNHAELGNALDVSNRDDGIRIANWPIKGLYMPDAIAAYSAGGNTYIVTANEGDSREYDGYVDESRVKDLEEDFSLTLDESAFPLAEVLLEDENLGRLKVIVTEGDVDDDPSDLEELYSFGARSFSVFNAFTGELVYDSGDWIETIVAEQIGEHFNSTNDEDDTFDNRSDDKGPEPEAITIVQFGNRTYVIVGLERVGGFMIFNISDLDKVEFVSYTNNRDFSVDFVEENEDEDLEVVSDEAMIAAGDLGPEGIEYVPASLSPTRRPLIIVANEVSGTTSIFEFSRPRRVR